MRALPSLSILGLQVSRDGFAHPHRRVLLSLLHLALNIH
jgi:hypothetical protein